MGGKPHAASSRPPAPGASADVRAIVRVASSGGGPLYVDAPAPLLRSESRARFAASGRLAGVAFESAFVPLGGRLRMIVPKSLAAKAGLYDGARVTLEVRRVAEPKLRPDREPDRKPDREPDRKPDRKQENPWTLD